MRAGLTSLGILFGVASVIAMLAIGRGARQEILEQMRLLGANNVVVTPIIQQAAQNTGAATETDDRAGVPKRVSPGLTVYDVRNLLASVPEVDRATGEVVIGTTFSRNGRRAQGKLVGVDAGYFDVLNLPLMTGGGFTTLHIERGTAAAVIGNRVKSQFFLGENPLGKQIKAGQLWLTVVGVVEDRHVSNDVAQKLGIRDPGLDIYIPLSTMLLRVRNRAQFVPQDRAARARMQQVMNERQGGASASDQETSEHRAERLNYHQLDRVVVRVTESRYVTSVADIVQRQLTRRHNNVADFQVTVPEQLLRQEQRTRNIFNVVLGSIASISLLVGGIGIMNIMLASVLERISEIGVRRALGARQRDVMGQFLAEAVLISIAGGVAGIILGVGLSAAIARFADIRTVVTPFSIALSVGVSITVGMLFGLVPAWRAAQQDPATCLRHE